MRALGVIALGLCVVGGCPLGAPIGTDETEPDSAGTDQPADDASLLASELSSVWLGSWCGGNPFAWETYWRDSPAYYKDLGKLLPVDKSVRRFRRTVLCPPSDGELRDTDYVVGRKGQGGLQEVLAVQCKAAGYLWATAWDDTYDQQSGIYRSDDGDTWIQVGDIHNVKTILPVMSGALLVATTRTGCHPPMLYRTTDGALYEGDLPDPVLTLAPTPSNASFRSWGFAQAANGDMKIAEYSSDWGQDRYIWGSYDDGLTWGVDHTEAGAPSQTIERAKHFHAIYHDEPRDLWLTGVGDGWTSNKIIAAPGRGMPGTWFDLLGYRQCDAQPIGFCTLAPGEVLLGSDRYYQVAILNMDGSPPTIAPGYDTGDHHGGYGYAFPVWKHEGLYYAANYCSFSSEASRRLAGLMVTEDGRHWGVLHLWKDNEIGGLLLAGTDSSGRLHMQVSNAEKDARHFVISPISPRGFFQPTGLVLGPPLSNELDTPNWSNFADDASKWVGLGAVLTRVESAGEVTPLVGEGFLQAVCTEPDWTLRNRMTIHPELISVPVDDTYQGEVWLRCRVGDWLTCRVRWYQTGGTFGEDHYITVSPERWQCVRLEPFEAAAGRTLTCHIRVETASEGNVELYVGAASIATTPGEWQIGGTPSTGDGYRAKFYVPDAWTHFLAIQPDRPHYGDSDAWIVHKWIADANNYIEVYYDGVDHAFKLRRTVDGVPQAPVASSAQKFREGSTVFLVLRCSAAGTSLSVVNCADVEHVYDDGTVPGLCEAEVAVSVGGADSMAYLLAMSILAPHAYADSEIVDAIAALVGSQAVVSGIAAAN
jgi:hypothetical protein